MAFDIIIAGAGIGGISAALAAARNGARTLLVEAGTAIGGTGVHSPVACICPFRDASGRPINDGIHRELFPDAYTAVDGTVLSYDEGVLLATYRRLLAAEPLLTVRTACAVTGVQRTGRRITGVGLADGSTVDATVVIDATADGHLAALAGCDFAIGREGDGLLQPATLTFTVADLDTAACGLAPGEIRTWPGLHKVMASLNPVFRQAKAEGRLDCPREDVLCFPYPDGSRILFNQTRVLGVDPTDPASVARGISEGRRQIDQFMAAMRAHPGMAHARLVAVSPRLGVREGRRITGDHVLTAAECLGEARFADMVAACSYPVDIHSPTGAGTRIEHIPGSGYYHIPYRSLIARDADNLLLGSRCLSGTHEAHASYRVMPSISAIGEAAGVAAALAARDDGAVRGVPAIGIRAILRGQRQFVEEPK